MSWYERNASTGALSYVGMLKDGVGGVNGLDGAISVTLSADGNHVYVTGSLDDAVSWYERNASTGALSYLGMLKDGVGGVDGLDGARSVTLSADGNHLYATGLFRRCGELVREKREHGSVELCWDVEGRCGRSERLDYAYSVTLSADGNHAYVTGRIDDAVSWFTRNPVTGALSYGSATDSNYTLTQADLGKTISVVASYTDGGSFDHNLSSGGTAAIQPIYTPSQPNHTVDLNASVNLEMIWVEPGTFIMGSPTRSETGEHSNETEHNVTLTKGFYLGKYEVTQAQYEAVMTGNSNSLSATPSNGPGNPNRPVEKVSWNDAASFPHPPQCERTGGGSPAGRLGLCSAYGVAMGICLPGGNDDSLFVGCDDR